jgi:hypothetical protein
MVSPCLVPPLHFGQESLTLESTTPGLYLTHTQQVLDDLLAFLKPIVRSQSQ